MPHRSCSTPCGSVSLVNITWMTARASSRRPSTTSHLGDSGSIHMAAAWQSGRRLKAICDRGRVEHARPGLAWLCQTDSLLLHMPWVQQVQCTRYFGKTRLHKPGLLQQGFEQHTAFLMQRLCQGGAMQQAAPYRLRWALHVAAVLRARQRKRGRLPDRIMPGTTGSPTIQRQLLGACAKAASASTAVSMPKHSTTS